MMTPAERAHRFVEQESAFHLGVLPTEQPHPRTKNLSQVIKRDTVAGVRLLQSVDRDIAAVTGTVFASAAFGALVATLAQTLEKRGRIVFSGCGATGRLSIQLEACWRVYCQGIDNGAVTSREENVCSIMTGGDYALVRSVESFEDYMEFGRQQVRDMDLGPADTLVAITEGGETSSVMLSCWEAHEIDARVFLVFNNPARILRQAVQRSRDIIDHPGVTVLELYSGPMAIAGSTRMQATTSELLVAGAALEMALGRLTGMAVPDYTAAFQNLLRDLEANAATLADYAAFEADIYRRNGLITYFADAVMIDIFTDTTERGPTFNIPPFRRRDDSSSPLPWAFAKNPTRATPQAWRHVLRRAPRCLEWTPECYRAMGAARNIVEHPPALAVADLESYLIGAEDDPTRYSRHPNVAVAVLAGNEARKLQPGRSFGNAYRRLAAPFDEQRTLLIGAAADGAFSVPVEIPDSPMRLWQHLAVKLALNTVSTAAMTLLGRVEGNWMAYVEATNKKLIDRSTRLVAELRGIPYADACQAVFEAMDQVAASGIRRSPVQLALELPCPATGRHGD